MLLVVAFRVIVGDNATPPEDLLPESMEVALVALGRTTLGCVRLGAPDFIIMSIVLVFDLFYFALLYFCVDSVDGVAGGWQWR